MRRTKKQLDLHRIRLSKSFNELEKELGENVCDIVDIKKIYKEYKRENRRIKIKMMEIVREFRNLITIKNWKILKMRIRAEKPLTLEKIAEKYGITRERIRQREARALEIIRGYYIGKY